MARHMLAYGRVLPRHELVTMIDAITVADVRRAGATLLDAPPTLAAIGPIKPLIDAQGIAARIGAPPPPAP
jgi:hypothetical protein